MTDTETVVFMQGDDADEALRILYGKARDDHSVLWSGPFDETIAAAFAHLKQWEDGEPRERGPWPGTGSGCRQVTDGGYVMTWSLSYGWIGLDRIIP